MASVGTVVIEVDADVAKFVEGIQQTNKKISSLERRAREAKKTIANFASAVVGIYAVGEAFSIAKQQAGEFLKTASDFEQYENRLSAFYKGQGEVNKEIDRAIDFSQKYNMSINDTMDSMIKMKVFGIDPTNKALEIFGNTAVGGGKSLDQFVEAMADAFQGENERLKEFGVKASVAGKKVQYAWSDSAGKSRNVVIDANKDIIQSTLETIFNEKYVGQMQLRADSWAGFVDGMKTDYTVFQKQVMDAGVFTYIKALTSSFSQSWTSSIGNTTDSAKMFSDYMQESIKSSIKAVAFFIDSWTGVKMVWAGLKVVWWGLVNGFQNAINWTADKWDGMTVGMHNAFKSFIDGAGTAWSSFINFFIKGINTSINAVAGLGNDMLDLMGIDPIKPINISLSKYESSIETAHKSTQKFLNTDYTGSALVDAMVDVQTNYDKLKNNSAQQFVENVLSKVESEQKKIIKNEDELNKKRKDAKKALDDLIKTNEGTLQTAKRLAKEKEKALKDGFKLKEKNNKEWENVEKKQKDDFLRYQDEKQNALIKYHDLLGDYDYGDQVELEKQSLEFKKYGINVTAEQIKLLEKQREVQDSLNTSVANGVKTIIDGVLAGKDLGAVLHNAMDGFNKSITDSFSKSITDSIIESVKKGKIVDFGIFGKNGELTSVGKNGAIALGNLFVTSAFNKTANQKRGTEYGEMAGLAIGSALGSPQMGALVGEFAGGILGSMLGGRKSYYTRVNNDGTVEAHQHTSGGLFSSSSDKILAQQTRQLQTVFDSTIKSYDHLLSSLFNIDSKIKVLAGKYSNGELLNSVIPQAVIDAWTKPPVSEQEINHLQSLLDKKNQLEHSSGTRYDTPEDEARLANIKQEIEDYTKKIGANIKEGVIFGMRDIASLTGLKDEALKHSQEIKDAWEAYAKAKDKSFNEVFVASLQGLQNTEISVFQQINKDDKIKLLIDRIKRSADIVASLEDSVNTTSTVTLQNFRELEQSAISNGATPEQVQNWTNLGQALVQADMDSSALADTLKKFKDKLTTSQTSYQDFFITFDMTDIERVNYQLSQAVDNLGLGAVNIGNYSNVLSTATTQNIDDITAIGTLLEEQYRIEKDRRAKQLSDLQNEKNKLISDNQKVIDSLANLRKSIKTSFENIYTDTLVKSRSGFYSDIKNKKYDNISNSFGTLTSQVQGSNLTDVEKFIELAKANQAVQNIKDPTADTNSIESRISALTDVTSTIATYTQGIKTDIKDTLGIDSPLFGIINKGLDKETYTQKNDENTFAWNGYQQELTHLNVNLANKTITNESEISKLRKNFVALKIEQEKANKLNAQLLAEQQRANEIAQQTANNTEKGLI